MTKCPLRSRFCQGVSLLVFCTEDDPIEFRLKNALRAGEMQPFSTAWSEGREPRPEMIETNGLEECVRQGRAAIGWDQKYGNANWLSA